MKKQSSVLLTIVVFLIALTTIRILWINVFAPPDHPQPVAGLLDLRDWDFSNNRSITLDGEWEFFSNVLLHEPAMPSDSLHEHTGFIRVPGKWRHMSSADQSFNKNYGSYRLRILVDPKSKETFALRISSIQSASAIYVNGELMGKLGQPATDKHLYTPLNKPYKVQLTANEAGDIDLVIHVADYETSNNGGIDKSLKFGAADIVSEDIRVADNVVIIASVVYLLHAIYCLLLYYMSGRDSRMLYFALLIICIILATLITERLLFSWFPLNYTWGIKLTTITVIGGGVSLVKCIEHHLSTNIRVKLVKPYTIICGIAIISIMILPVSLNLILTPLFMATSIVPALLAPFVIYRTFAKGREQSILLLLAVVAAIYSFIWLIYWEAAGTEIISYPFDLMIALICFAAYWFNQYFHVLQQSQQTAIELQKANKEKDDFLAVVAHEMKNPLHGILNLSHTVVSRENSTIGEKDREDLNLLISVGHHMSMLINDLLDLTRLHDNRLTLRMGSVSIHEVVEVVVDMLSYLKEGKRIQLLNQIPDDFPRLYADENRLFQIMFNLLHNAVKHSDADTVCVNAVEEDTWARISVIDNGQGIAEQYIDTIFEPYERAAEQYDDVSGGIGLGLSVSQQLAQLHGGKLEVSSVLEQGTTFTLSLKLLNTAAQMERNTVSPEAVTDASAEVASTAELLNKDISQERFEIAHPSAVDVMHILAVDDDLINLKVLQKVLDAERYNIHTAASGEEALAMLEQREWDLVLADIMMPNMSGYELTRTIRKRFTISELPILLLTARDRPEDVGVGFLAGANDYLKKPVNAYELRARVDALTSLKRSVQEKLHMEVAYLQAQIQPHFLLNTLNSIAALSKIDMSRMHTLLADFGEYLKSSFDFRNLERVVPIEHELNLVRSYLNIEKERFEQRLQVEWDVDPHLSFNLPPLTIQPLVENAVRHGVLKKMEGGTVRISIKATGDQVDICVADDGVGMDEETMQNVYDPIYKQSMSIGLYNTNRRLEQTYNKGLHIETVLGKGTKISFSIPQ